MKKFLIALSVVSLLATEADARGRLLSKLQSITHRKRGVTAPESSNISTAPVAGNGNGSSGVMTANGAVDALDMLNAKRARMGLQPYLRDDGLTIGALNAAAFRASHLMFGHTSSDFSFLPPGSHASSAGCAGNGPQWGFMACNDTSRRFTYAGAAYAMGRDGRMYCHLFVR